MVLLTNNDHAFLCPGESDIDLVSISDKTQVPLQPPQRWPFVQLILWDGADCAEYHIVPLIACKGKVTIHTNTYRRLGLNR